MILVVYTRPPPGIFHPSSYIAVLFFSKSVLGRDVLSSTKLRDLRKKKVVHLLS